MYPYPYSPNNYAQQLQVKQHQLEAMLAPFNAPALVIHASKASHYRMRAEFKLWHEGDQSWYAMFNPAEPKQPLKVTEFLIGSRLMNELMAKVLEAVHQDELLRQRLFQVEFLTTQAGDALISLIYHKQLDDAWAERGRYWQAVWGFPVIGRARKQRLVLERDYVNEILRVQGKEYHFRQYENAFTQPNAGICEQMLSWSQGQTANTEGDLLELYCGNGNFSIPLAQNFNQVLGTEISRVAVHCAQHNIANNGIDNLRIARMSSEDFASAWLGQKTSRRFCDWQVKDYQFSTLLIDPPRAGLDADTLKLASQFERILYVSCNPTTLVNNLSALGTSYRLTAAALFDQFPYTPHMEAAVLLIRN